MEQRDIYYTMDILIKLVLPFVDIFTQVVLKSGIKMR